MRSTLIALFLLTSTAAFAQSTPRVYLAAVGPDASGFSAPGGKERAEVLKELTDELKKKKSMQVVASPEQADLTLEVTAAAIGPGNNSTTYLVPYTGSAHTANNKAWHATVELKAGAFKATLLGEGLYLGTAARVIAKDVDKWVIDNRAQLSKP